MQRFFSFRDYIEKILIDETKLLSYNVITNLLNS